MVSLGTQSSSCWWSVRVSDVKCTLFIVVLIKLNDSIEFVLKLRKYLTLRTSLASKVE